MREYSNQLGLTLLKMHRDTAVEAETEFAPDEIEEIRERLIKKLQRIEEARMTRRMPSDEGLEHPRGRATRLLGKPTEEQQRRII